MVNVSKIVRNFKTGASIPAIVNLALHKANQLSASCDQKGGNLKLKFEVKLSQNILLWADWRKKSGCSSADIGGDLAEFSIIL